MRILAILIGAFILACRGGWSFLRFAADRLVPRFLTEDVAVASRGDVPDVVCSMLDIEPGEEFAGIATVRSFTWFGLCFLPRQIGAIRPWVNPHD